MFKIKSLMHQPIIRVVIVHTLVHTSKYCIYFVVVVAQFDYKGYIYELLDEQPEKLSSLQTLSVRRLTPPSTKSTDDDHDRCKINQLSNLVNQTILLVIKKNDNNYLCSNSLQ